jgi:SPP1 family predicted phage head-tail adaptor
VPSDQKGLSAYRVNAALQRPEDTPDGAGGTSRTWTHVAYLWLRLVPLRGNDAQRPDAAGASEPQEYVRIETHFRTDMEESMRLVIDGRAYAVVRFYDPSGERKALHAIARRQRG